MEEKDIDPERAPKGLVGNMHCDQQLCITRQGRSATLLCHWPRHLLAKQCLSSRLSIILVPAGIAPCVWLILLLFASLLQLLSLFSFLSRSSFLLPVFSHLSSFLILFAFNSSSTMSQLQDPIAPHSDSLCQIFNQEHPSIVLTLLRHVTRTRATVPEDDPILSAKVVDVNQFGLTMDGQTAKGRHVQAGLSFRGPVHSLTLVTESFLKLGKEAEQSLSSPRESRKIPGQPPGLGVYWPHWTPFLIALAVSVSCFFLVYFFPDATIQPLKWIKDTFGMETVTTCVHFAVFLHSFQLVTAWYLMKDVAKCSFSVTQVLIWSVCVQFFGIGSMLKLLPIVYNSDYVSQELEEEKKREA